MNIYIYNNNNHAYIVRNVLAINYKRHYCHVQQRTVVPYFSANYYKPTILFFRTDLHRNNM